MNKDQVKGRTNTVTGKIKEGVGKATDDKELENRGRAEKTGGKVRSTYGDAKSDIKKSTR
ncbi:MAG: CsbD family protein [Burkholderiaceae bacterium]